MKKHTDECVDKMLMIYKNMVSEVSDLEKLFPGRHFTLDGHLIGSIGEAFAKEYYGIDLAVASNPIYDGTINGYYVQIKTVQQDRVVIRYASSEEINSKLLLLVLYLNKTGTFYEVFNGPVEVLLNSKINIDKNSCIHISVNKLIELQKAHKMYRLDHYGKVDCMSKANKN